MDVFIPPATLPKKISAAELFHRSCIAACNYPANLPISRLYKHQQDAFRQRLEERADSLFAAETDAFVFFLELEYSASAFSSIFVSSEKLDSHLGCATLPYRADPQCRYVFIHAPHSMERLDISRSMFTRILTFHQVTPSFLEFVFPFGHQMHLQDFHHSGFRHETKISSFDRGLPIPDLGRSGRTFQLCYMLKSVEPTSAEGHPSWHIRNAACYHSFDVVTGQTTWIVIKANAVLRERISESAKTPAEVGGPDVNAVAKAFASSLQTHHLICSWASENWRWYINSLEEDWQEITLPSLLMLVEQPYDSLCQPTSTHKVPWLRRSSTLVSTQLSRVRTFCSLNWEKSRLTKSHFEKTDTLPSMDTSPTLVQHAEALSRSEDAVSSERDNADGPDGILSIQTIQRTHRIEEKVKVILQTLESNCKLMADMEAFYANISTDKELAQYGWIDDAKNDIVMFRQRLVETQGDLQMQLSRVKRLLSLMSDRMRLLYGILDYQQIKMSQHSSASVERMTRQMHGIAEKTEQETVSMRIITLVTLFFLPGTFISTLMSTPIVTFPEGDKAIGYGALRFYLRSVCL